MAFRKETFSILENGAVITKYILTNEHGLKAAFTDLGGIWLEMWVPDKHGTLADVVLGYDEPEKYLHQDAHFGEIVGRNANRISNATCTIDGITYALVINDNGINNLHSGPDFLRDRIWDAEISETEAGTKITFSLFSPDGDQNYPGNADIRVSYTLTEDDAVRIDYHMTCDEDTIANFTNHAYFNLAGQGSGSALDQKVWIDADQFTLSDQYCVTTGELALVKDTPMDFTQFKAIGRDIEADYEQLKLAGGYDHNWVLNHKTGELSLSAKAMDEASGRVLEVYTDLPGIQFYTANFLTHMEGKNHAVYDRRDAYCFESQYFPDAVNKPQFASPILKGGDIYKTTTIYKFKTEA